MQNMGNKNYYDLLGVDRSASKKEIKSAYKDIAQVYHPDSNFFSEILSTGVSEDQLSFFKDITAAYHILINEAKRADYDRKLAPDLPGWDDVQEDSIQMKAAVYKATGTGTGRPGAQTFGTFGVVRERKTAPMSAFDSPPTRLMPSVSEMLRQPKASFFSRILSIFGL